jgi:hypothetical protein
MVAEIHTLEAEEDHLLEDEATRVVAVENLEAVEAVDLGEAAAGVLAMMEEAVEVTIDAAMIEAVGGAAAGVLDHEKIMPEGKEEGVETIMTTGDGGVDARCDRGLLAAELIVLYPASS